MYPEKPSLTNLMFDTQPFAIHLIYPLHRAFQPRGTELTKCGSFFDEQAVWRRCSAVYSRPTRGTELTGGLVPEEDFAEAGLHWVSAN